MPGMRPPPHIGMEILRQHAGPIDAIFVAIGGGVSGAGDFLFEPLRLDVDAKCFFKNHGSVVPAQMGNAAGIVGAAMLYHNACNG